MRHSVEAIEQVTIANLGIALNVPKTRIGKIIANRNTILGSSLNSSL
jgi:hypothetical protein